MMNLSLPVTTARPKCLKMLYFLLLSLVCHFPNALYAVSPPPGGDSTFLANVPVSLSPFATPAGKPSVWQELEIIVPDWDIEKRVTFIASAGFELAVVPHDPAVAPQYFTDSVTTNIRHLSVYIRMAASAPGMKSGHVSISAPGEMTKHITITGTATASPVIAQVDTLVTTIKEDNYFTAGIFFTGGFADRFTLTAGTRVMPGFVTVTGGTVSERFSGRKPTPTGGYYITVPKPENGAPGTYDFNLVLRNSFTDSTSAVYKIVVVIKGIELITPLQPMTTIAGTPSAATSISFTARGLKSNYLMLMPTDGYFEYALAANGPWRFPPTPIMLDVVDGQTGPQTIYVRLAADAAVGQQSGTVQIFDGTLPEPANLFGRISIPVSTVMPVPATITAVVDSLVKTTKSDTVFSANVHFIEGFADRFMLTAGARVMPGFEPISDGTLGKRYGGRKGELIGYAVNVPKTVNVAIGTYDFNLVLKNDSTGNFSANYKIVLVVRGLENVTPPQPMTTFAGTPSAATAMTFTAKGLTSDFLLIRPLADGFEYALAPDGPWRFQATPIEVVNGQAGPQTIYVRLAANAAVGEHSGSFGFYDGPPELLNLVDRIAVPLSRVIAAPVTPTTASYGLKFTNTTSASTTLSWTNNGNGTARAVFIAKTGGGAAMPVSNMTYTANGVFGAGTQIGSTGWYCVYNGTGSSVNITGLSDGTYRATVIDYNGTAGTARYLTTGTAPANVVIGTLPPTSVSYGLAFSNTTATSTKVSWSTSGNGSARAVFIAKTGAGAAMPVSNITYTANGTFGAGSQIGSTGWYCVYNGKASSADISGLSDGTYRVTVIDYNGIQGNERYLTTGTAPANVLIGISAPTAVSYGLAFSNTTPASTKVSWSVNGNGSSRAVFIAKTGGGAAMPVSNITYTANGTFGAGSQIGSTGWYCVYNGTASSADVTGLSEGVYRVTVIDYNGTPGNERYLTAGTAPANVLIGISAPTAASYGLSFINTTATTTTVNWSTNGNGSARAVFVAKTTGGAAMPLNGVTYTASNTFGTGTQIGSSGWYCVYKGTASSANISGLSAGTYRVTVIDYNGTPGSERYLTTGTAPANIDLGVFTPTMISYGLKFTDMAASSVTLSWTHNGNGESRAVFIAKTAGGAAFPANNTTYTAVAAFGAGTQIGSSGWYCVYNGTGSSVNINGLSANTNYRVTVVDYDGSPGDQKYLTTGTSPASFTTGGLDVLSAGRVAYSFDMISYQPASGTIEAANILTPNNDGKNDTWYIKHIEQYPNNIVTVLDAAGKMVFTKKGYTNDWSGYAQGSLLNAGTYYYLIDLGDGEKIKGFITLVR
ncbi:gliding motility-associated C-terminal domain-containing protein [Hufsiella ginkgonis]|uniref:T9SS type B sorting domain-containing protein n=1 Tax=Hufsiella ginkgonis TaxID=2695274 RepID=A0A7K1Y0T8_9SPHI|nr:gliding motility-associated C-terminal domain-containing protein [Hufsiella ginkgonis]MXV16649.1 T9SS type B sorting domain-containing protein [Hufsiella ginkgonis]